MAVLPRCHKFQVVTGFTGPSAGCLCGGLCEGVLVSGLPGVGCGPARALHHGNTQAVGAAVRATPGNSSSLWGEGWRGEEKRGKQKRVEEGKVVKRRGESD